GPARALARRSSWEGGPRPARERRTNPMTRPASVWGVIRRLLSASVMISHLAAGRATRVSDPSARGRGDLGRVLLGVLADAPSEELDGLGAERGMAPFTGPLGVGQGLEQARELLLLGDHGVQKVPRGLAAGEAGAAIAFLVEIGEERRRLVEEPPDAE